MKIYNIYQSGTRLYIDEKENPDNKIVCNKYESKQKTLRLVSDGTLPPRLYWALRNPKLSNKYFILPLIKNEDLVIDPSVTATPGLWDLILVGTPDDYIIEGADIDQSKLTYISDTFSRLFVRDNYLEELDIEEQIPHNWMVFYDDIIFQLSQKEDAKFVAEFDVTTFEELEEAYQNGRSISALKVNNERTFIKLEAGTYDADGNLLQSWDELMTAWENHMKSCGLKDCTPDISRTNIVPPYCVSNAIPSEAEMLIISDTVTSIGNYMFYFYGIGKNLRRIIIPESVTDIKTWAFGYRSRLECVSIANNNVSCVSGAFSNITSASIIYYSGTLTASYLTNNTTTPTIMPYEEAPNEALGFLQKDIINHLHADLHVKQNDLFIFNTIEENTLHQFICDKDSNWTCVDFDLTHPTKISAFENDKNYLVDVFLTDDGEGNVTIGTSTQFINGNEVAY